MKKSLLHLLCCLILQLNLTAQSKTVAPIPITTKVKAINGTVFNDRLGGFSIIGSTKNSTYGISAKSSEITIYEIGNNGNLNKSVDFKVTPYRELKRHISKSIIVKDQIYLFFEATDKKSNTHLLLMEELNMNTLLPQGKITKIDEISFEKRRNQGTFTIVRSNDKSKILLYKDLPYEKDANEKYELTVFDEKMNKIWNSPIEMPYNDKDLAIQSVFIDNDGDVVVSAKKWNDIKSKDISRSERKANYYYDYILLFVGNKGKEIKEFQLDIEKKWITDAKFRLQDDGKVVAGGFYSEKSGYGIKGVFFVSIDKTTQKLSKYSLKEFSVDFLYAKMSEKQKAKAVKKEEEGKGRGLLEFTFRELVLREDGGILLMAEQNYVVVNCTTDPRTGTQRCTYTYYYNDIVVINVSPSGDIEWTNWVPKRQVSGSPYYLSYDLHVSNSKMYFVFNDNIKNYQLPKDELIKKMFAFNNFKKGVLTVVTMDLSGNQEREVIAVKDKDGLFFVPNVGRQIDSDESIIFFQKKNKKRFTLLNFE